MKKILCLLSSAVMFVSLVACGSFTSSSKQQNIDVMTNAHYFATVIKSSTLLNHCYIVAGEVLDAYSEKWDGTNVYDECLVMVVSSDDVDDCDCPDPSHKYQKL